MSDYEGQLIQTQAKLVEALLAMIGVQANAITTYKTLCDTATAENTKLKGEMKKVQTQTRSRVDAKDVQA